MLLDSWYAKLWLFNLLWPYLYNENNIINVMQAISRLL